MKDTKVSDRTLIPCWYITTGIDDVGKLWGFVIHLSSPKSIFMGGVIVPSVK